MLLLLLLSCLLLGLLHPTAVLSPSIAIGLAATAAAAAAENRVH
jgi:hypothetical protein